MRFSNGEERTFERLASGRNHAVMVVPSDGQGFTMVREYAVGREAYELGFVKGLIDPGETPEQAANRELQEEIGMAADSLQFVRSVGVVPHYNRMHSDIFIAHGLHASRLQGDEPEPLEAKHFTLNDIPRLLQHPDINDARTLFVLAMLPSLLSTGSAVDSK